MNRQHTRTYRRRTRLGLPAAALALAAATFAAAPPPAPPSPGAPAPAHATERRAHAELAGLTLAPVAPLGIGGFRGTYGVADSPRAGTTDDGDFTDPDGVLPYLTVTGQKVTRTAGASARARISGLALRTGATEWARVRPRAGSTGSLDTYAECAPTPTGAAARAYARSDATEVLVLGHLVAPGTTTLRVTGAELKHPSTVRDGTLTVTYAGYQQPQGEAPERARSARAGLRVHVTGTLRNTQGAIAYQGDLVDLRLGEVTADCAPAAPPSATPEAVAPASPSATPSPSASPSPSRTASAVPAAAGAPGPPGPGAALLPGGPGMLAGTGTPAAMWLLGLSATLVVAGTGLVLRARHDIRAWGA
ncbi:hypothetical protein AB0904_09135 [Streptomyces sp. NPDC006684]|uniref:hypothetical protein n=1 Tax=Streptomyces sp. NPDC006684 TaxID=3154477 RepID=UPI00345526C0